MPIQPIAVAVSNPMTRAATLQTIRLLRHLADTLEHYGPQAYASGGLMFSRHDETVPMAYDECQRALGPSAYLGSDLSVEGDLVLRIPVHAPLNGLKQIRFGDHWYRWDGEPARPVRAGDVYNGTANAHEEMAELFTAPRDLKKVRFIYTIG